MEYKSQKANRTPNQVYNDNKNEMLKNIEDNNFKQDEVVKILKNFWPCCLKQKKKKMEEAPNDGMMIGDAIWSCFSPEEQIKNKKEWLQSLLTEAINIKSVSGLHHYVPEIVEKKDENIITTKTVQKLVKGEFDVKKYNEKLVLYEDVYEILVKEIMDEDFWENHRYCERKTAGMAVEYNL